MNMLVCRGIAITTAFILSGGPRLEFDDRSGWLPSVLEALDVPVSSQTLVFSKTSLQQQWIRPGNPGAIYFNDDVYIG